MNTSRRNFIKTGAFALAATAVMNRCAVAANSKTDHVGVQLFSIRDDMTKDPIGSLKLIAGMGYKNVEHANYIDRKFYGYPAKEFKKILEDLDLVMVSGHTVMGVEHWDSAKKDFTDAWKYTVEDAAILQQKYMISPWMDESFRKSYDDLKQCLDIFNKCGELCKSSGMKFGYHNHDFEFSQVLNNEKVFDILMQTIDPALVVVQLDIGNMLIGGAVASDIIKQYPNRFENIHVKDIIKTTGGNEEYESTILGEGIIQAKDTIELATRVGGTIWYIIEQESYQGKAPMDCLKTDLAIIREWGY